MEQIEDLVLLGPSRFSAREHAALSWVRAFLQHPEGVPSETEEKFQSAFSEEERICVIASMKGMFCVNLASNTGRLIISGFQTG